MRQPHRCLRMKARRGEGGKHGDGDGSRASFVSIKVEADNSVKRTRNSVKALTISVEQRHISVELPLNSADRTVYSVEADNSVKRTRNSVKALTISVEQHHISVEHLLNSANRPVNSVEADNSVKRGRAVPLLAASHNLKRITQTPAEYLITCAQFKRTPVISRRRGY